MPLALCVMVKKPVAKEKIRNQGVTMVTVYTKLITIPMRVF